MFSNRGLFKNIPCPQQGGDCTLPTCWFSHDPVTSSGGDGSLTAAIAEEYDPFSAGANESPPPAKRRKLGLDQGDSMATLRREVTPPPKMKMANSNATSGHEPKAAAESLTSGKDAPVAKQSTTKTSPNGIPGNSGVTPVTQKPLVSKTIAPGSMSGTASAQSTALHTSSSHSATPMRSAITLSKQSSLNRPVSPPPTKPKANDKNMSAQPPKVTPPAPKTEPLAPRHLGTGRQPAQLDRRAQFVQLLHKNALLQNQKACAGTPEQKKLRLTAQELITLALDEEERTARKYDAAIYQNILRQRIAFISPNKMTLEQWKVYITAHVPRMQARKAVEVEIEAQAAVHANPCVQTGMPHDHEVAVLKRLVSPLNPLQKYGYITVKPSDDKVTEARKVMQANAGWEQCDRCNSRFQVFPGRDEQGNLTSGGICHYHWAKAGYGHLSKYQRATGGTTPKHGCCGQEVGSQGCTQSATHVFGVKDPNRLASIWQWEQTPDSDAVRSPISFDCEMCYTTNGMEVIRVTAVSWPDNKTLLDILVRPFGEILDFNARFSGVSRKLFAEAPPHQATADKVLRSDVLFKVASPPKAREILFDLITPTTPVIGHAIENDLNTLRIIHPTIVDTVLLYPHPKGLPIRYGLKALSSQHLGRAIQMGADQGHDSKEDAVATGDLVTLAVKTKWRSMQNDGWNFVDGALRKSNPKSTQSLL
jgi:DNA polymerase III epsilon subunit-like protein